MVWMFYTSFKLQWEIFADPFALPTSLNPINYIKAWTAGDFNRFFFNSVIVTIPSVVGILLVSALAAFHSPVSNSGAAISCSTSS